MAGRREVPVPFDRDHPVVAPARHVDAGEPNAGVIARRYGRSRVVLGFGAANGGALFARWLRWNIMRRFGYTEPNAVYLDGDAPVPETCVEAHAPDRPWLTAVASRNDGWRAYSRAAMAQSRAVIFVGTKEFGESAWTPEELEYFDDAHRERARERRPPLKGIALVFPGCTVTFPGITTLACRKEALDDAHDDWVVGPQSLLRIMTLIGPA